MTCCAPSIAPDVSARPADETFFARPLPRRRRRWGARRARRRARRVAGRARSLESDRGYGEPPHGPRRRAALERTRRDPESRAASQSALAVESGLGRRGPSELGVSGKRRLPGEGLARSACACPVYPRDERVKPVFSAPIAGRTSTRARFGALGLGAEARG